MSGRFVPFVSLFLSGALVLVLTLPAAAASETWRDEFNDMSLTTERVGVFFGGGSVRLAAAVPQRQGLQLGASSDLQMPSIVRFGSSYLMYYTLISGGSGSIALATSSDANTWTPQGVVISPGFAGSTDSSSVAYEDVLLVGSTFHMWYSGIGATTWAIHHATSSNGVAWTSGGVVISGASEGVSGFIYAPSVIWDGASFTMWFTNYNGQYTWIRKATSSDGIAWSSQGIVLSPIANGIDDQGPRFPGVIRDGSDYLMWYNCVGPSVGQVCRARSPDGASWAREGVAIAPDPLSPGENIGVGGPEPMLLSPGSYRVWYGGRGSGYPDAIYSALVVGGYRTLGTVVSVPIGLPKNLTWLSATLNATTPAGTSVSLTFIDATTGLPIEGYANLTARRLDLLGIRASSVPRIALQAWLTGPSTETPTLDSWSVTFGNPPAGPPTFWEQYQVGLLLGLVGGGGAATLGLLAYTFRAPRRESPPRT